MEAETGQKRENRSDRTEKEGARDSKGQRERERLFIYLRKRPVRISSKALVEAVVEGVLNLSPYINK